MCLHGNKGCLYISCMVLGARRRISSWCQYVSKYMVPDVSMIMTTNHDVSAYMVQCARIVLHTWFQLQGCLYTLSSVASATILLGGRSKDIHVYGGWMFL